MPLVSIAVVVCMGLFLSGCGKKDSATDESANTQSEEETAQADSDETGSEDVADQTAPDEEETTADEGSFDRFSDEIQTVGCSDEADDADYSLTAINDTEMAGYHRFKFVLESDEDQLPEVEARLVSSGGYISVRLDRITSDESGIGYQSSRRIDTEGIVRIYHQVTPVESEEVYQVGITDDTIFYLHEGSGLSVLLDVKYPGADEGADTAAEDSEDFIAEDTTLTGTNTSGDAKLVNYSWSVGSDVVSFVWGTSADSGNPTPPTDVMYDGAGKKLTVSMKNVLSDTVIGSSGEFESDLTAPVENVVGSREGTTSTYVFHLTTAAEYRIYRSTSPNQLILEVQR